MVRNDKNSEHIDGTEDTISVATTRLKRVFDFGFIIFNAPMDDKHSTRSICAVHVFGVQAILWLWLLLLFLLEIYVHKQGFEFSVWDARACIRKIDWVYWKLCSCRFFFHKIGWNVTAVWYQWIDITICLLGPNWTGVAMIRLGHNGVANPFYCITGITGSHVLPHDQFNK